MTDKLDLSLPSHKQEKPSAFPAWMIALNLILLALVCAVLALMLFRPLLLTPSQNKTAPSSDVQKNLAIKLEKQGMNRIAAEAWKEYVSNATLNEEETARVWFRIGKLHQEEHDYDRALAAYYRSEGFKEVPEIQAEISRRIQECLESAGRFAALRDELSERVGIQGVASGSGSPSDRKEAIAEIGPEKITRSDLDHLIEKAIDQQLSSMAAYLPEGAHNQQKEELLKQFSGEAQRSEFLHQYLARELLYREARAQNLAENPQVLSEIRDQEKALLAEKLMEKAYAENIHILPDELQAYYDSHREAYQDADQKTIKPFEEVQNQVYAALRAEKERQVSRALLDHLKDKYDVVIHASASMRDEKTEKNTGLPQTSKTQESK